MILFIFCVGYGNRHPWYQLPLVPIAAVFAGVACTEILARINPQFVRQIFAVLIVLLFAVLTAGYTLAYYTPASEDLYEVALRIKETTPADARIVVADGGDPTVFYYAHRKGWHFLEKNGIWNNLPRDSAEAIANLEQLRSRGAAYLVFPFRTRWWLDYYDEFREYLNATAQPVEVTPRFAIYRLTRSRNANEPSSAKSFAIRPATLADVPTILGLIRDLAEYERAPNDVVATEEGLREVLFGEKPSAEVVLAMEGDMRSASLSSSTIFRPGSAGPDFIWKICSLGRIRAAKAMDARCSSIWRRLRAIAVAGEWSGRCSIGTSRRSSSTARSAPRRTKNGPSFA